MKTPTCSPVIKNGPIFRTFILLLLINHSAITPSKAQVILSVTHSDTYDFNGSQINLISNPDFEQPPAGHTVEVWYAVVNTSSGCGYNTIPSWSNGPVGYESYATLAFLRPSGGNFIFNDAFPALGGTGTCSGPPYPVTPDDVMSNSPLVAATDASTNWMMYFGNWEDVKKVSGAPSVNLATGEVVPVNTVLSFIANGAGASSNNTAKSLSSVSQTIRSLPVCHTYELEFFLTGEGFLGNNVNGSDAFYPADGMLELTIDGTQMLHLMSPGTGNFHGLGSSEIYHITFLNPSDSVTIQFASAGHLLANVAVGSPAWASYLTAPVTGLGVTAGNKYRSSEILLDGVRLFDLGAGDCTVLSTELVSFNAVKERDEIKLTWQATEEKEPMYYEVQHSTDGRQWETIGQVQASDDAPGAFHNYGFIHREYSSGYNYYRLHIVQNGGRSYYSAIKMVRGNQDDGIRAGPNPVTNRLAVTGAVGAFFDQVEMTDLQGRRLLLVHHFQSGDVIDMAAYKPGIYLLKITGKGAAAIIKRIEKINQ